MIVTAMSSKEFPKLRATEKDFLYIENLQKQPAQAI